MYLGDLRSSLSRNRWAVLISIFYFFFVMLHYKFSVFSRTIVECKYMSNGFSLLFTVCVTLIFVAWCDVTTQFNCSLAIQRHTCITHVLLCNFKNDINFKIKFLTHPLLLWFYVHSGLVLFSVTGRNGRRLAHKLHSNLWMLNLKLNLPCNTLY